MMFFYDYFRSQRWFNIEIKKNLYTFAIRNLSKNQIIFEDENEFIEFLKIYN